MFISKLLHLTVTVLSINQNPDPMIKLVASVVPILNGRDSEGNVICLGPQSTKIHRYLLVIFLAKSTQMFRLLGKEIDNSIYFTLYKLWQVANSFKDISPYHLPIRYDRTKVVIKVYNMISNTGPTVGNQQALAYGWGGWHGGWGWHHGWHGGWGWHRHW